MYWYLSFLRPPPVSVKPSAGSITITPQVANDLRTEVRYEPTEIAYIWQCVFPDVRSQLPPEHLTTFCPPESSYKSLDIPLPSEVKLGEKWRLGLFHQTTSSSVFNSPTILGLTDESPGVIGVWSEGIEIVSSTIHDNAGPLRGIGGEGSKGKQRTMAPSAGKSSKGKGKAKVEDVPKQGRISREWDTLGGRQLRITEQTSFDLDKKIWDSGLALSSWIWRNLDRPEPEAKSPMRRVLRVMRKKRLRAIELGSGTGLVSIATAQKLETMGDSTVSIVATDLESAIPLMENNLQMNPLESANIHAKVLDWEQPLPDWIQGEGEAGWPELIIAADVTYNTASFPHLLKTLCALLKPSASQLGGGERPVLLLAYKQRDIAERGLWDLLMAEGIEMIKIDSVQGAEEEGVVEIWLGSTS